MVIDDLYRDVIQAALDFDERQLWKRFSNFDYFAVRLPGECDPVFGIVMGQGGEEFGLTLFRGQGATRCLSAMQGPLGPGDDVVDDIDVLGFSMGAFRDLPPDAKALTRKAGRKPDPHEQMPQFIVKQPGRQPRLPDKGEFRTLLLVMRGVLEADDRGLMNPGGSTGEAGVLTLTLTGDPGDPTLSVDTERLEAQERRRVIPFEATLSADTERLEAQERPHVIPFPSPAGELDGLARLDTTWLVGLPPMPVGIEGDERSLQLLLIADDDAELVLHACPVFAGELQKAVDALIETFHDGGFSGRKGLPRKILFSSRKLHDAVAPILQSAGVECAYVATIPKLQEIMAEFFEVMDPDLPPYSDYVEGFGEHVVPAADDLTGWKEADRRLVERFADFLEFEDRPWSSRAAKRYFGDEDLEYFFGAHEPRSVVPAYTAWGILDYRPTKKSKTHAEKMLAEGLPEPQAILLQARMDACPTLYRVAGHDAQAGTVRLDDVLLGGAVTVHDRLLAETGNDGVFVAGRAFPTGRFHFFGMAGPPLGALMGMEAVEFLQDCGMEFTREGLRRDAHLFGRLWEWLDMQEANWEPPRLCNTDGDDLLWHTASFTAFNQQEVRRTLLKRKNIKHDEENDEFIWFRDEKDSRNMLGGPLTLGRIELVGDELVLTVNSAERFAEARDWLEKVPGVVFQGVTTHRWDEAPEDRPMDETILEDEPVEMTPELTAAVQGIMDKQYMAWLDRSMPALGGKSPRETCQTAAGRRKVAMLVRTMPEPVGPGSVRVPRQAILRELGLEAESRGYESADVSMSLSPSTRSDVPSSGKIGRNDPCPCGSGKKYKKCCGQHA